LLFLSIFLEDKTGQYKTLLIFMLTYMHMSLLQMVRSLRLGSWASPHLTSHSLCNGAHNPVIVISWLLGSTHHPQDCDIHQMVWKASLTFCSHWFHHFHSSFCTFQTGYIDFVFDTTMPGWLPYHSEKIAPPWLAVRTKWNAVHIWKVSVEHFTNRCDFYPANFFSVKKENIGSLFMK
jgi:hypothetical protein